MGTARGERSAAGWLCVRRAGAVRDGEGSGEAGGGKRGGGGGGTEARVEAVHARPGQRRQGSVGGGGGSGAAEVR